MLSNKPLGKPVAFDDKFGYGLVRGHKCLGWTTSSRPLERTRAGTQFEQAEEGQDRRSGAEVRYRKSHRIGPPLLDAIN
jgi:hypothetical protein